MKVYIASAYYSLERLLPERESIEAMGHEVTSSWLVANDQWKESKAAPTTPGTPEHKLACALLDLSDVKRSDMLVLDVIDVSERGGREVEWGVALALGIPVVLIGPTRNVFHELAFRHFEGWEEALLWLDSIRR